MIVVDYATGHELVGQPSEELANESAAAPSGAVSASWDGREWSFVAPADVSQAKSRGELTVWVQ